MVRPRFRLLPHTGDLRLVVWGDGEEALVANAVAGTMATVLGRTPPLRPRTAVRISPWPSQPALRAVRAANEALFQLYARRLVATGFATVGSRGALRLAPLPPRRRPSVEVKAVTYHDLELRSDGRRLRLVLTMDV
jgi:SHS2 domain-containing protein